MVALGFSDYDLWKATDPRDYEPEPEDEPYLCEHGEDSADCGECLMEQSFDEWYDDPPPIETYAEGGESL